MSSSIRISELREVQEASNMLHDRLTCFPAGQAVSRPGPLGRLCLWGSH